MINRFITYIVKKIPRIYLIRLGYVFSLIMYPLYKGDKYECPICGGKFKKMLPYGNKGWDNRLCPKCLSLERHRLLWLFLKQKTTLFDGHISLLHIAPEQPFLPRFKKIKKLDYVTADLESPIADIKMDVREIPFPKNQFDAVICNHVLEHIEEEELALQEIYRVIRPDGWAILQVPLDIGLEKTYEDAKIRDPKEREKHFGQYDHVRIYGRDYPERLKKAGFSVKAEEFVKTLSHKDIERYRLDKHEIIYVCYK